MIRAVCLYHLGFRRVASQDSGCKAICHDLAAKINNTR